MNPENTIDLTRPITSKEEARRELRFLCRFYGGKAFLRWILELGNVAVPGTVLASYMSAPRDGRFGDPGAVATAERYLLLAEKADVIRRKVVSFEGEDLAPLEAFWLGPEKGDAFAALLDVVSP